MRNLAFGTLLAAGIVFLGIASPSAALIGARQVLDGALVGGPEQVQYGGYCESLRRACIYKDQLGEAGEGNCRRYRRECGGAGSYGAPQRYERRQGGQDRCTYWHHRCANAYGWHTRSWHKCMKYGAPGC